MKRSNDLQINIGLENNPKTAAEILDLLTATHLFKELSYSLVNSSYKGVKERTLVVKGTTNYKLSKVTNIVENFCNTLTQDCIPFVCNGNSLLVFSNKVKPLNQFPFDAKFFKTI